MAAAYTKECLAGDRVLFYYMGHDDVWHERYLGWRLGGSY